MAVIAEQSNGREEIALNELLSAEKNIGKVFNLDSICMLSLLHEVEKLGEIKIIRTAGLDVVRVLHKRISYMVMGDLMTGDEKEDVKQIIKNARATEDAELPPMI